MLSDDVDDIDDESLSSKNERGFIGLVWTAVDVPNVRLDLHHDVVVLNLLRKDHWFLVRKMHRTRIFQVRSEFCGHGFDTVDVWKRDTE